MIKLSPEQFEAMSAGYSILVELLQRAAGKSNGVHVYAMEGLTEVAAIDAIDSLYLFVPKGAEITVDSVIDGIRNAAFIRSDDPHVSEQADFELWQASRVLATKSQRHLIAYYTNVVNADATPDA